MNATRIFRLATVLFFLFSFALAAPAQSDAPKADPTPLFAYDNGPSGQSTWEGVCNSNARHFQAPINVPSTQPNPGLPAVRFVGYDAATPLTTTMTNPHNLKIYTNQRRNSVIVPGTGMGTYTLQEFHFHRPSEEAINGRRYPMVIHFVHVKDNCTVGDPNCVVAIAVLVEEGQPRADTTALLSFLFQLIPPPAVTDSTPAKLEGLMPVGYQNAGYYRYPGSLTTPPCTENLTFFLLKTPIIFSAAQITEFTRRYPMPNARDIQELNTRPIENR